MLSTVLKEPTCPSWHWRETYTITDSGEKLQGFAIFREDEIIILTSVSFYEVYLLYSMLSKKKKNELKLLAFIIFF
jgi:hypothetical protein